MSERDTREDDENGEAVSVEVQDGDETAAEAADASASEDGADPALEGESEHGASGEGSPDETASGEDEADDEPASAGADDASQEDAEASSEGGSEDSGSGSDDAGGDDFAAEFDPTDYLESQVEALRAELSAVQKELETAQNSANRGRDEALRAKADFENFKKRKERELERLQGEKVEKVLLRVLPVYDTFGRAIDQYEKDNSEEALYDGLQRIEKMFQQLLESQGITAIEAEGKPFDPNIHDAVCRVEIPEDGFDEMVVDVFETGYIYGEKVLKPAKVSVAKE